MLNAAAPVVWLTTELFLSLVERSRQFAIRGGRPFVPERTACNLAVSTEWLL